MPLGLLSKKRSTRSIAPITASSSKSGSVVRQAASSVMKLASLEATRPDPLGSGKNQNGPFNASATACSLWGSSCHDQGRYFNDVRTARRSQSPNTPTLGLLKHRSPCRRFRLTRAILQAVNNLLPMSEGLFSGRKTTKGRSWQLGRVGLKGISLAHHPFSPFAVAQTSASAKR